MLSLRYSRHWMLASYLLLLLVFAAALLPDNLFWQSGPSTDVPHFDKLAHGVTFMVLTVWFCGQYARGSYWRPVPGMVAFGLAIEFAQSLVSYRTADGMDLLADLGGVAGGMIIVLLGAGGWCLMVEEYLQKHNG